MSEQFGMLCHKCLSRIGREHEFLARSWNNKGACDGCGDKRVPKVRMDRHFVEKAQQAEEDAIA